MFLLRAAEPISPEQSAARIKVPEGFRVQLVAGEPTLIKPIAMTTDEKGRLWVVESHSYPHWLAPGKTGKDRVLILEPTKEGWSAKVFLENQTNLSGIAIGHGGVWLLSLPNLILVPKNGEDRPSGPAQVLLEGWSIKAKHNVVNGLQWGPDGWLYGMHGITDKSYVGLPGAPKDKRTPIDCGIWRYHLTKKVIEQYATGTTNPWGMDWNDHGELFLTNCVIKHLFHVIPGAHYVRMYGDDLNRHIYGQIESCADHIHWGGGNWTSSRGGKGDHSVAGGGHAHAGAMFYLGDNWPAMYRDRIFMCNIHGNRLNSDRLERFRSGYVAKHCDDFLHANDEWFRGLGLCMSDDGGMFVSDWHDTGECHNYDKTHPSGRIYKVTFGPAKPAMRDLNKASDGELVELLLHKNEWWVRHARRLLQERARAGKLEADVATRLWKLVQEQKDDTRQLRALWALYSINQADPTKLLSLLEAKSEAVRTWAVRLLADHPGMAKDVAEKLSQHAEKEEAACVRLALASALQKMAFVDRWNLAAVLSARQEDASDPMLPLMIWYGVEAAVPSDVERATDLLSKAKIPLIRRNIARRLAALAE
jgi:putative membrane-bound dehydrogenase-like protein